MLAFVNHCNLPFIIFMSFWESKACSIRQLLLSWTLLRFANKNDASKWARTVWRRQCGGPQQLVKPCLGTTNDNNATSTNWLWHSATDFQTRLLSTFRQTTLVRSLTFNLNDDQRQREPTRIQSAGGAGYVRLRHRWTCVVRLTPRYRLAR